MTYTWPIVISVETDDVGVEGESRDDPWIVMVGRRAYRWRVDPVVVFAFERFADLELIVSSLVVGDGGDRKAAGRQCLYPRISVRPKGATDLGESQELKGRYES